MNILKAYEMFMQEQQFRGNSPETISYYRICLNMFIEYCGSDLNITDLDIILFKGYQLYLAENKNIKRVSVQTYSRAVRVFYRYLYEEDLLEIDVNKLKLIKANKEVILPLSDSEVKQLLAVFDDSVLGVRDKLICMLMLDCGLRRGEVVNLKNCDINFSNNTLVLNGKGNKQRVVPFGESVKKQLILYKNLRPSAWMHDHDTFFLTNLENPITNNTVKMMFQDLKERSGITRIYPHLLRHTFATNYIYNGGNLEVLRVLLGHSTISITQIYIHLATQMHLINDKFNSHLDNLNRTP